jgi:hypothetical protein
MEQLDFHWMDFHEILYLSVFFKICRENSSFIRIGQEFQASMQGTPCIPDSHTHRVTNTKRRIDKVISPDDGHTVAQNM